MWITGVLKSIEIITVGETKRINLADDNTAILLLLFLRRLAKFLRESLVLLDPLDLLLVDIEVAMLLQSLLSFLSERVQPHPASLF